MAPFGHKLRERSGQMRSLADALTRMQRSPALAQIQRSLAVHRSEHDGDFAECKLTPCRRIEDLLRWMIEQAQEELVFAHKLREASKQVRNALPGASDRDVEYLARAAIKPTDGSDNPILYLESPYDPARTYNARYPGLEFHRGRHKTANPAISSAYFRRFSETDDDAVLFEFKAAYPVEFACSGWVTSAFGRILLGLTHSSSGEERARSLFRRYWKGVKYPKPVVLPLPQQFVLKIAEREEKMFSGKHRKCFKAAFQWLRAGYESGHTSDELRHGLTVAFTRKRKAEPCFCISSIEFEELGKIAEAINLKHDKRDADVFAVRVLQKYIGAVCGTPDRTIRLWKKALLAPV